MQSQMYDRVTVSSSWSRVMRSDKQDKRQRAAEWPTVPSRHAGPLPARLYKPQITGIYSSMHTGNVCSPAYYYVETLIYVSPVTEMGVIRFGVEEWCSAQSFRVFIVIASYALCVILYHCAEC